MILCNEPTNKQTCDRIQNQTMDFSRELTLDVVEIQARRKDFDDIHSHIYLYFSFLYICVRHCHRHSCPDSLCIICELKVVKILHPCGCVVIVFLLQLNGAFMFQEFVGYHSSFHFYSFFFFFSLT